MKIRYIPLYFFTFFSIFLFLTPNTSYAEYTDINNHWASIQISEWIDNGLIKGYSDGSFQPDAAITRAEFIALVNRIFNYKNKSAINFSDVSSNDWFSADIEKAVKAGYINGYEDNSIRPDNPLMRQESAKILALAFDLNAESGKDLNYKDSSSIDSWAVKYVENLTESGIIKGNENGMFLPQSYLTRAEAVTMLNRLCGNVINQQLPELPDKHFSNNVLINKPGVKLKNTVIEGNLYLTEGIDSGEINLENVTVSGSVYVKGCSADKIIITKCNLGQININSESPLQLIASEINADSVVIKSSTDMNILSGSKIQTLYINACSKVVSSDLANISSIYFSENAEKSVVYAKAGIRINSDANSIKVNNKDIGRGNYVTESCDFDVIDIN